jgi:hypothetical protein
MKQDDRLSHFLNEESKFSSNGVKRRTMMPRRGSVSVFVTEGMEEDAVWAHGDAYAGAVAVARADLKVRQVKETAVETSSRVHVVFDGDPPLHANITGFPEEKEHVMEVAQVLADKCGLPVKRIAPGEGVP